jgi:hypothetical protein
VPNLPGRPPQTFDLHQGQGHFDLYRLWQGAELVMDRLSKRLRGAVNLYGIAISRPPLMPIDFSWPRPKL